MLRLFIKTGEKEHLEQLFSQGHVFMNTLEYYRKCEGMSQDKSEGSEQVLSKKRTKPVIFPQTVNPAQVKGFISLEITKTDDLKKNIFCLHTIEDDLILDPKNLKRHEYALIIKNPQIFIDRIDGLKKSQGLELSYQSVEYVDRNSYDGELGPFRKYKEFENEKEFRFF